MLGIPGVDDRCKYRTKDGRRCTMLRMDDHPSLCYTHSNYQIIEAEAADPDCFAADLLGPIRDFTTATAVNQALGRLFVLLARRRIAPRSAAILAYICQLLLATLPAVQKEAALEEELSDEQEMFRAAERELPRPAPDEASFESVLIAAFQPGLANGAPRKRKGQGNDLKTPAAPRMLEGGDENRAGPVQSHRRGL